MEHSDSLFFLLLLQLVWYEAQGAELTKFLEKYKTAIEKYVMAGYGGGWDHCDVVTEYYHDGDFLETVPQLVMELERLQPSENPASSSGNFLTWYSLINEFNSSLLIMCFLMP